MGAELFERIMALHVFRHFNTVKPRFADLVGSLPVSVFRYFDQRFVSCKEFFDLILIHFQDVCKSRSGFLYFHILFGPFKTQGYFSRSCPDRITWRADCQLSHVPVIDSSAFCRYGSVFSLLLDRLLGVFFPFYDLHPAYPYAHYGNQKKYNRKNYKNSFFTLDERLCHAVYPLLPCA